VGGIQRKTDHRQDRTRGEGREGEGRSKISYGFEGTAVAEGVTVSLLQSSLSAESIFTVQWGLEEFKLGFVFTVF
jgi:hypothetical protein